MASTVFDKIWDSHVVQTMGDGWAMIHIDRHLLHDLSGTAGLKDMMDRSLPVHNPELAYATPDHAVSSAHYRTGETFVGGARLYNGLKRLSRRSDIPYFDLGQPGHGIVHVMGPELGIVLPGLTVVCGDSHTCTNGALGAIAFGIGSSEVTHALATQTLLQRKPKNMRILFEGSLSAGVTAKDMALHLLGRIGASAGTGFAIEYAGSAVQALSVEERMTLCNLSIELGAKIGIIAPDAKTIDYVRGREFAPGGEMFTSAVAHWSKLLSDADAVFDAEFVIDTNDIEPTITWGTSPEQVLNIGSVIPDPDSIGDLEKREAWLSALNYMGLTAGKPIVGTRVDRVFIGSCTNSRLSDLRLAASLIKGRVVASHVAAWVVPGSQNVKLAAEKEGLDTVFKSAGFDWREPGCSMCVAANGEQAAPGERVVSTSNRNFVGRQGPGARTHLASPGMAVAAALRGEISDVRSL